MDAKKREHVKSTCEDFIDAHQGGTNAIAELIAEICFEKAEHIRTNWQDKALAWQWELAARRFQRTQRAVRG